MQRRIKYIPLIINCSFIILFLFLVVISSLDIIGSNLRSYIMAYSGLLLYIYAITAIAVFFWRYTDFRLKVGVIFSSLTGSLLYILLYDTFKVW